MEVILVQAKTLLIPIGQWNAAYPTRADFITDMARGECYVLTCGSQVGGFFTLSAQPEACYADITDGKWSSDQPYTVLHRCAIARQWRGSGLADRMIGECEKLTMAMGRRWLRSDTHKKNKAMQNLLRRNGFQYRGNVLVDAPAGRDPRRLAFELRLTNRSLTGSAVEESP